MICGEHVACVGFEEKAKGGTVSASASTACGDLLDLESNSASDGIGDAAAIASQATPWTATWDDAPAAAAHAALTAPSVASTALATAGYAAAPAASVAGLVLAPAAALVAALAAAPVAAGVGNLMDLDFVSGGCEATSAGATLAATTQPTASALAATDFPPRGRPLDAGAPGAGQMVVEGALIGGYGSMMPVGNSATELESALGAIQWHTPSVATASSVSAAAAARPAAAASSAASATAALAAQRAAAPLVAPVSVANAIAEATFNSMPISSTQLDGLDCKQLLQLQSMVAQSLQHKAPAPTASNRSPLPIEPIGSGDWVCIQEPAPTGEPRASDFGDLLAALEEKGTDWTAVRKI